LFIVTVAIPITPIYLQVDLIPEVYEWLLLVWVTGQFVNELTSPGRRTGIARVSSFQQFINYWRPFSTFSVNKIA